MTTAGDLKHRIRFERRALDARGVAIGPFVPVTTVAAAFTFLRGGEAVVAQRLEGLQPLVVRIRSSKTSRAIDTAWRAVNARTGATYEIKSVEPVGDAWLDLLCEIRHGEQAANGN